MKILNTKLWSILVLIQLVSSAGRAQPVNSAPDSASSKVEQGQQSLKQVTETLNIHQTEHGLVGEIEGKLQSLDSHSLASMTFWGITPILMAKLENDFKKFLEAYDSDVKKEYYLPNCIQTCIENKHVSVRVYSAVDFWFGVTFKEELTSVAGKIYEHRQG